MFIVFDGHDGTGKSTLADATRRALQDAFPKMSVILSSEPTNGIFGAEIRRVAKTGRYNPVTETALFIADRVAHIEYNKRHLDDSACLVIFDRYYFSTCAYQSTREGTGIDAQWIAGVCETFCPIPDVVFHVHCDLKVAQARMSNRGETDLFEELQYQERVRAKFFRVFDAFKERHPDKALFHLNTTDMTIETAIVAVKSCLSSHSPFFKLAWGEK